MRKKLSKKQREARRILSAEEERRVFEQGVQLGIRIAQQGKTRSYLELWDIEEFWSDQARKMP